MRAGWRAISLADPVKGGPSRGALRVEEISLAGTSAGANLLAAAAGGKIVAAEPPFVVGRRLYWLVMIPGIVFTGLTLAMALLFPLTEHSMREIHEKLERIRRQRLHEKAGREPEGKPGIAS